MKRYSTHIHLCTYKFYSVDILFDYHHFNNVTLMSQSSTNLCDLHVSE